MHQGYYCVQTKWQGWRLFKETLEGPVHEAGKVKSKFVPRVLEIPELWDGCQGKLKAQIGVPQARGYNTAMAEPEDGILKPLLV